MGGSAVVGDQYFGEVVEDQELVDGGASGSDCAGAMGCGAATRGSAGLALRSKGWRR